MQGHEDQLETPETVENTAPELDISDFLEDEEDQQEQTSGDLKDSVDAGQVGLDRLGDLAKESLSKIMGAEMVDSLWLSESEIQMGRDMGALNASSGGGIQLPRWLAPSAWWSYIVATRGLDLFSWWQQVKSAHEEAQKVQEDGNKSE